MRKKENPLLFFAALCPATPARDRTFQLAAAGSNPPRFSEDGVQIRVIEICGRLHACIEVGEDTTHEALDRAIPLALQWRERLLEAQGPDLESTAGTPALFLIRLDNLAKEGMSPAQIAQGLNVFIGSELHAHIAGLSFWAELNQTKGLDRPYPVDTLDFIRGMLTLLGMPKGEVEDLLLDGLERIKAGRLPFDDGYPVSAQRVKDKLRTWRRSKKYQAGREQEPADSAPMWCPVLFWRQLQPGRGQKSADSAPMQGD